MRRFRTLLTVLSLCVLCGSFGWARMYPPEVCKARLQILYQAVELWANRHHGQYPDAKAFRSNEFKEYVEKVGGKTGTGEAFLCPATGKRVLYYRQADNGNYTVNCPNPAAHGKEFMYYSHAKGYVEVPNSQAAQGSGVSGSPAIKPAAAQTPSPSTSAAAPATTPEPAAAAVPEEERKAVLAVIRELYEAYKSRDTERVMAMEAEAVEKSAQDYQKQGKGDPENVRRAFREATEEVLKHKDFKMMPLNLENIDITKENGEIRVTSVLPIIETGRVTVDDNGQELTVRLRIAQFSLHNSAGVWKISQMELY